MTSVHLDIVSGSDDADGMRTTLHLDDDVYRAAKSLAEAEGRALGEVISMLARRGLAPRDSPSRRGGLPAFSVALNAPALTPSMVRRALDSDVGGPAGPPDEAS